MTNQYRMQDTWSMQSVKEALGDLVIECRGDTGATIGPILTDSRAAIQRSIFVALKGEKFDGHDYAQKAGETGASLLIVERPVATDKAQIIVTDTAEAYGALARAWRSQYGVPVICVVGSNGKTTTTQMIASILRAACGEGQYVATEENFNNGVGVPRTLLRFNERMKAAVVEAGMNHPGEMAQLVSWIRPTVVVMTNAQREHQEFIDGVEGAARENGIAIVALSAKGTAVLPSKDGSLGIWQDLSRARGCHVRLYCEGENDAQGFHAAVTAVMNDSMMTLTIDGKAYEVPMKIAGRHAVHDAAAAATAALAAGVRPDLIAQGLATFEPVEGRGVRHELKNGAVVIDDAYNANPDSMLAAVDVLSVMPGPRVMIVGDMAETGSDCEKYHAEIGAYAKKMGIDKFLATGTAMQFAVIEFGAGARHFDTLEELTEAARIAALTPGTFLVKASHSSGLSSVVKALTDGHTVEHTSEQ